MARTARPAKSTSRSSNGSGDPYGLVRRHGLSQVKAAYRNLPVPRLVEMALARGEGCLAPNGALVVLTGRFTGRSPKDKFTVDQPPSNKDIWWGEINQRISPENWDRIFNKVKSYLQHKEVFIFDGFLGTDPRYKMPVRVITEKAWHSLFCATLFVRPTEKELQKHKSAFTVIDVGTFLGDGPAEGLRQGNFTLVNFEKNMALVGGSEYAGEMKKSAFFIFNYLLPKKGVFPMHCSSNTGEKGDTALFFGLSGTGKTTLSADPHRRLIGDDEHGWSDKGVFNFEGGCYAKTVNLSREKEPRIWDAIRFGSVLENVVIDPETRQIDFGDTSITENTRVTYPVEHIDNCVRSGMGGHPKNIFFLACDAFGVLPPISKLTPEQAMYHFLSGYTAKVAGTEAGVDEPEATFSACFAAPFLALPPGRYAELLRKKITRHKSQVWLLNTGWSGGPAGKSDRISLRYTRAMITAAFDGTLLKMPTKQIPIFNLHVPTKCPDVPSNILQPRNAWKNKNEYDKWAQDLAARFRANFKGFENQVSEKVRAAAPV